MVYCCAYSCKSSSANPGNSFYRFPLDNKDLLKQWLARIKRKNFTPTKASRVCHLHFELDCFELSGRKEFLSSIGYSGSRNSKLKPNAVPTIFSFNEPKLAPKRVAALKRRRREVVSDLIKVKSGSGTFDQEINNEEMQADSSEPDNDEIIMPSTSGIPSSNKKQVEAKTKPASSQTPRINYRSKLSQTKFASNTKAVQTESITEIKKTSNAETQCNLYTSNEPIVGLRKEILFTGGDDDDNSSNEEFQDNEKEDPSYNPIDISGSESDEDLPSHDMKNERKFIVFESCLMSLFATCLVCSSSAVAKIKQVLGTMVAIEIECVNRHVRTWFSQPTHGKMPLGNLISAAVILFSGGHSTNIIRMFNFLQIPFISSRTYFKIQKFYLHPTIMLRWQREEKALLGYYRARAERYTFGGDGRCDSPGHSAKYGSYTLMDLETGEIVTFQLVQSNEVTSSTAMELEGLKRCMKVLDSNEVYLKTLITDRHIQVRKYLRESYPEVAHQFDAWHISKAVAKKFNQAAKINDCQIIERWTQSLTNHLHWCACSSPGRPLEKKDKWLSLLNHISNKHTDHDLEYFKNCIHPPMNQETRVKGMKKKKWIREGTMAHIQVSKIVKNTRLCNDIKMISSDGQTSSLEGYHSQLLTMAPKNTHFFYEGMQSRLALAALHNNENSFRCQKENANGELRYKTKFPKAKKGRCIVSAVKEEATYDYVDQLIELVFERRSEFPSYEEARLNLEMQPNLVPPPLSNTYTTPPPKAELIRNHVSRFQN